MSATHNPDSKESHPMQKKTFGLARLFADARQPSIEDLREKQAAALAQAKSIQAKADAEARELTDDEVGEIEGYTKAFDAYAASIARREKIAEQEDRLNAPGQRRSQPPPVANDSASVSATPQPRAAITGHTVAERSGTKGFLSMGEFSMAVRSRALGGQEDPRLRPLAAVTSSSSEGVGADGGYLVPPDFRTQIFEKVMGEDSLVGRTDQQTTTSNSITFPVDENTPWDTSNGVQAYWEGEGATVAQSKVVLRSVSVRATKLAALLPVTDELLEDASSLNAYMARKVAAKIAYRLNDAIINGDGINKPLGLLNSPAIVSQAAEGGQTSGTVVFNNIVKMWARMYAPCRRNAVWLCNQDLEPQLASMVIPAASGVSSPAYLPASQGLVGNPYNGTLMGRPIVYTEATQAIGTVGDIILADLSQYLTLTKSSGLRADSSIHLWFDQGTVAFRFTLRMGGMPWWASSIARAKGGNTLSCFVSLAAR